MKNSAWYHKLWLKKLSELPVKEDPDTAWAGMKELLDVQLPVVNSHSGTGHHGTGKTSAGGVKGAATAKTLAAKVIAMAVYVLPVAAAIGVTAYFVMPALIKPDLKKVKKEQQSLIGIDTAGVNPIKIARDSVQDTILSAAVSGRDLPSDTDTSAFENLAHKRAKNGTPVQDTTRSGNAINRIAYTSSSGNVKKAGNANKSEAKKNTGKSFLADTSSPASMPYPSLRNQILLSSNSTKELSADNNVLVLKDQASKNLTSAMRQNTGPNAKNIASKSKKDKLSKSGKDRLSKNRLSKNDKDKKAKKSNDIITPDYNFGLEAGLNTSKNSGLYFGALTSYKLNMRLLLNAGIRINTSAAVSGNYTTKTNDAFGDSSSRYKVSDSRKIMALAIPLTLEYKISSRISVNAGAVISFPMHQTNQKIQSELLLNLKDSVNRTAYLDSVRHHAVDSTLNYTKVNKINIGITGGISYRLNQFYFEAKYLQNITPYKVNNALGGYNQYFKSFQLGIRYQFKK